MKGTRHFFPALLLFSLILMFIVIAPSYAETIAPAYEIPYGVQKVLDIAVGEVGYTEGAHGYSKYGEWSGDPYAQWCAEYLCWCVDQADQQYGLNLSNTQYPIYSAQNVGRDWFIEEGRYVARNGEVDGWGSQWLKDADDYMKAGDYIPQPGDWVFFTWTSGTDTDHVAMVEYCTREENGSVLVHVLEGNAPSSVQRNEYWLTSRSILGFGTVHDVMDITIRHTNTGKKVTQLQEKLIYLSYLEDEDYGGYCGAKTVSAIKEFQSASGLSPTGVVNLQTGKALDKAYRYAVNNNPATWIVQDDEDN